MNITSLNIPSDRGSGFYTRIGDTIVVCATYSPASSSSGMVIVCDNLPIPYQSRASLCCYNVSADMMQVNRIADRGKGSLELLGTWAGGHTFQFSGCYIAK